MLWVFYLHVCLCTTFMQYLHRPEDGVRFPKARVTFVSCPVLGIELGSFGRVTGALNH